MSEKKSELIFIATIHRMSERVISAINELQKTLHVKIINFGQISSNTNNDANLNYHKYVSENFPDEAVFNLSGVRGRGDIPSKGNELVNLIENIVTEETVAIILCSFVPVPQ